jgi:hypothetical protein
MGPDRIDAKLVRFNEGKNLHGYEPLVFFKGQAVRLSCDHIEMANMLNKYFTRSKKV